MFLKVSTFSLILSILFFYFSDLDAFDDAKFSRLCDYISEHLSRDSCLLCLGNLICREHIMASNLPFFSELL